MVQLAMSDAPEEKRKFVVLYERYCCLMRRVAMNVLHDEYLAEDAVHNAFVRLAKNMDRIGDPSGIAAKRYLIALAKSAAIDLYRKRAAQSLKEFYADELPEGVDVVCMETEAENQVLDVLKNLPVKYRDVFLLKYSAQLDDAEIARLCGIKPGSVRQRVARGKVMIEEALKELNYHF